MNGLRGGNALVVRPLTEPERQLQAAIRERRALLVAGSGVSVAASCDPATGKSHPQASWSGLLESGLEWLKRHDFVSADVAAAHMTLIKGGQAATHHFVSAAQDVTRLMGGPCSLHYRSWLDETIGTIRPFDRTGLEALHALRVCGNLLATTNYDGLLLEGLETLTPVTWKEPDALFRTARQRELDKVIFLHGYWRQPESVVLDWDSYQAILRDDRYREDLVALWKMTTWVFVGCGINGIGDPDLGLLLERYGKRARQAGLWDFCLVTRAQRDEFQARFDELQVSIRAIAVGETHDALPAYLRALLPVCASRDRTAGPAPQHPDGHVVPLPRPPMFRADPDYIASHEFIGRESELQDLNEWARAADPTNLLLFDAIGGSGKSMLTWEWAAKHAPRVREDWVGRFWYTFYRRGAAMPDLCRRALGYMTGRPVDELQKLAFSELADELLAQLHARPWLLVLDGLERILVAFHRMDAAEVPDEEADAPVDRVLSRNPCDTIRDTDGELLRALAGGRPSKILVTSRLVPRVLLNSSNQAIPGARRITLPGLRPSDAEQLLRSCGVRGDSWRIQEYLAENCGNHPLVIGVLAGLITNYLPGRGDFDAWAGDAGPQGGANLDLANLDLVQRRNHILRAALDALSPDSRRLLSTLALVPEAVDYEELAALSPFLPPAPEEVAVPAGPEHGVHWAQMTRNEKQAARKEHQRALARRVVYESELRTWMESSAVREAPATLAAAVEDLEQRGLLQYDSVRRRHDLHPVVRGVAAGGMRAADRDLYGQRVVDYFSTLPHNPYEEAAELEDVTPGLHVVRTLLKLGRTGEAARAYTGELAEALAFNLEGYPEMLSLLRPFFPSGWDRLPEKLDGLISSYVAGDAAAALGRCGEYEAAVALHAAVSKSDAENERWDAVCADLCNLSFALRRLNRLAGAVRLTRLALNLAEAIGDEEERFASLLCLFALQAVLGTRAEAERTWLILDPMGRDWSRATYRQGQAEEALARAKFRWGELREADLVEPMRLAEKNNNRGTLRELHLLRASWLLERAEWASAASSFDDALRMARERRLADTEAETGLALAKLHLGRLKPEEGKEEAARLAGQRWPAQRLLAELARAAGDCSMAGEHAIAAYREAWGDGEPYVDRHELSKAAALLRELGVALPALPSHDSDKGVPYAWEATILSAIEALRRDALRKAARHAGRQLPPVSLL